MLSDVAARMLATFTWGQWLLAVLLIFVCFLLMIVILLQKGRGGGLAGAFGGAGGTSAFGAKTGDVFTWITVVVASVFVLLTVVSNFAFDQSTRPKTDAAAQPVTTEVPLEGVPGPKPGEPIKIQLGTTDPVTGEQKFIPVGGDGAPISIRPSTPPPPAAPAPATDTTKPATDTAKQEPGPESKPAEPPKEEEKSDRPNP